MVAVTPLTGSDEPPALIQWHTAARAYGGEAVSGDHALVTCFPGGALAAAIDGLGHGPEAAAAAHAAAAIMRRRPTETVTNLMTLCHDALRLTRGAVISLASFDAASATVTWLGVGDVAGLLIRRSPRTLPAREILRSRGGVVGYRLPPMRAVRHAVRRDDILVFATDGIRTDFDRGLMPLRSIEDIAEGILHDHGRDDDDALVLVVRCGGMPP
jgi:negative regulator of sigma-B (phosphoserine phosphatase)